MSKIKRLSLGLTSLAQILISGCQNETEIVKYPNGKIKSENIHYKSDSFDVVKKNYYPSGALESIFHIKGQAYNGLNENYYKNGKIESKGYWHMGKKKSWFNYYDSMGNLDKIIEYIPFKDSSISKPNQIIHFGSLGDTIKNGQSIYYEYYSTKDSIRLNKDSYTFKIVFAGHAFKYAYIRLCDFDEEYNIQTKEPCAILEMNDYTIQLSPRRYKIGENTIRGYILNTKNPLMDDKTVIDGEYIEVYFSDKFYVLP